MFHTQYTIVFLVEFVQHNLHVSVVLRELIHNHLQY
jgi:hypothetical protein